MPGPSGELIDKGDVNELLFHVNGLVADGAWAELEELRAQCRRAFERGKQLGAVSAYIEYRVCLEGPGRWAALMLESGEGRFALGPLPEVAASTHTWAELAPHLHATPQAAMAAHERVVRGEDLSADVTAAGLPEVLDVPLRLQGWEPAYALATYRSDEVHAPPPRAAAPLLGRDRAPGRRSGQRSTGDQAAGGRVGAGAPAGAGGRDGREVTPGRPDEVSGALEQLAAAWVEESNGSVRAACVEGTAVEAVEALGPATASAPVELAALSGADAVAWMAWSASDGGAHGRRRGSAPGRYGAWWALATIGGLAERYPLAAEDLGPVVSGCRWYRWEAGGPPGGWSLRLALEAARGPLASRAWAVWVRDST